MILESKKLLDTDVLRLLSLIENKDDKDFLSDLIALYLENANSILRDFEKALYQAENANILHLAHKLKGMSANLGAIAVYNVSERIETQAKIGKLENTDVLYKELNDTFRKTQIELQSNWLLNNRKK